MTHDLMPLLNLGETSVADAMREKAGQDISPAESPPGKHLADMEPETLALVLIAIEGMTRQLQHAAFTRHMQREQQHALIRNIGSLQTAANQIRRYLAANAPRS